MTTAKRYELTRTGQVELAPGSWCKAPDWRACSYDLTVHTDRLVEQDGAPYVVPHEQLDAAVRYLAGQLSRTCEDVADRLAEYALFTARQYNPGVYLVRLTLRPVGSDTVAWATAEHRYLDGPDTPKVAQ